MTAYVEDYDCPSCSWSLHVESRVWEDFPNHHEGILTYIEQSLQKHIDENHGNKVKMYNLSSSLEDYHSSYIYYSGDSHS